MTTAWQITRHDIKEIIMDATIWTKTSDQLPPEGEVVRALGEHGTEQDLKRSGNLWHR